MKSKLTSYLCAMTTVVLWAMSYIWADRLLDRSIPVEFFVPVRILLAGFLLFLFNRITGQKMKMYRKDLLKFLLLALCMPFIYFVAETYGLKFTESPTITSLVIATNPIFAMFVGLLIFREKVTPVNAIGVFITLAGLWLVTWKNGSTGDLFLVGILSSTYSPSVIVMYQFLLGAVFFLPLFFTKGLTGFDASTYISWPVIYPILALAVLCSATAFTTWAVAIKNLGVAHTSVFLAIVPLVTAFIAFILGEETLSLLQWAGLAVGMVGIYLTQKTA